MSALRYSFVFSLALLLVSSDAGSLLLGPHTTLCEISDPLFTIPPTSAEVTATFATGPLQSTSLCSGGQAPSGTAVGALVSTEVCRTARNWTVVDGSDPDFPAMKFNPNTASECSSVHLSAFYILPEAFAPGAVIVCEKQFISEDRSNVFTFAAEDCTDSTLPDDGYRGVMATGRSGSGNDNYWVFQPGDVFYPGMAFWNSAAAPVTMKAIYLAENSTLMSDYIFCRRTDLTSHMGPGYMFYSWTTGDCGGTLPDSSYVGIFAEGRQSGTDRSYRVHVSPTPGMSWSLPGTASGPAVLGALYVKPVS